MYKIWDRSRSLSLLLLWDQCLHIKEGKFDCFTCGHERLNELQAAWHYIAPEWRKGREKEWIFLYWRDNRETMNDPTMGLSQTCRKKTVSGCYYSVHKLLREVIHAFIPTSSKNNSNFCINSDMNKTKSLLHYYH